MAAHEGYLLNQAMQELCQMRIATDRPCPRPATTELWSVPLCEPCTREQEAYFSVGDLTQELAVVRAKRPRGFCDELLAEVLYRVRRECVEHVTATEKSLETVTR